MADIAAKILLLEWSLQITLFHRVWGVWEQNYGIMVWKGPCFVTVNPTPQKWAIFYLQSHWLLFSALQSVAEGMAGSECWEGSIVRYFLTLASPWEVISQHPYLPKTQKGDFGMFVSWLWSLLCVLEVWDSLRLPGCSVCCLRSVRAGDSGPGALRKLLLS